MASPSPPNDQPQNPKLEPGQPISELIKTISILLEKFKRVEKLGSDLPRTSSQENADVSKKGDAGKQVSPQPHEDQGHSNRSEEKLESSHEDKKDEDRPEAEGDRDHRDSLPQGHESLPEITPATRASTGDDGQSTEPKIEEPEDDKTARSGGDEHKKSDDGESTTSGKKPEEHKVKKLSKKLEQLKDALDELVKCEARVSKISTPINKNMDEILKDIEAWRSGPAHASEMELNRLDGIIKAVRKLKGLVPFLPKHSTGFGVHHGVKTDYGSVFRKIAELPNLHDEGVYKKHAVSAEIRKVFDSLDDGKKLCLLCFAVFPEKAVIKRRILTYWWVGERLIDLQVPAKSHSFQEKLLPSWCIRKGQSEPQIAEKESPMIRAAGAMNPNPEPKVGATTSVTSTGELNPNAKPEVGLTILATEEMNRKANPEVEKKPTSPERIADDILKEFVEKGLIETCWKMRRKEDKSYMMPPIVRTGIILLAKESKFFEYDPKGILTSDFLESGRSCLTETQKQQEKKSLQEMEDLERKEAVAMKKLRTIFNVSQPFPDLELEALANRTNTNVNQVKTVEWLLKMRMLNVLYLGSWDSSGAGHFEVESTDFLNGLASMNKLRFLSLQGIFRIIELPKCIKKLKNLRILDLKACHNLEKLPRGICSLTKLTHLDISDCFMLDGMPKGLSSLMELQVLKGFVVSGLAGKFCSIVDLKDLKNLRKLSVITNRKGFPNQKELFALNRLGLKGSLTKLSITWGEIEKDKIEKDDRKTGPERTSSKSRLKNHIPTDMDELPEKLEKLDLRCFREGKLPAWVVPGKLKRLKKLYIRGGILGDLGSEKWEVETLYLKYLTELEIDWFKLREKFPNLSRLEWVDCPRTSLFPCDENGIWIKLDT